MEAKSTNLNGKIITHKHVISYNTTSTFTFKQRLQILLGKKVNIYSAIFTMSNEVKVVETAVMTVIGDKRPPLQSKQQAPLMRKVV